MSSAIIPPFILSPRENDYNSGNILPRERRKSESAWRSTRAPSRSGVCVRCPKCCV